MSVDQETLEMIEDYLLGKLSDEKKLYFEKKLIDDIDLQKEIELYRTLKNTLENKNSLEFRKKILTIASKQKHQSTLNIKKENYRFLKWKIAAAFALVIGVLSFLYLPTKSINNELYDKYHTPYPIESRLRGDVLNINNNSAFNLYAKEDYSKSIPLFKNLITKYPDSTIYQIYLGNSLLKVGMMNEAKATFQKVNLENKYYEDSQWYLALTYLKIGNIQEVKKILRTLINYEGVHEKNSTALLEKLKSLE